MRVDCTLILWPSCDMEISLLGFCTTGLWFLSQTLRPQAPGSKLQKRVVSKLSVNALTAQRAHNQKF